MRGSVLGDGDVVGQEDRVHQTAFGDARYVGVVREAQHVVYVFVDHAPGGFVVAVRPDEGVEVQWPCAYGIGSFIWCSGSTSPTVLTPWGAAARQSCTAHPRYRGRESGGIHGTTSGPAGKFLGESACRIGARTP